MKNLRQFTQIYNQKIKEFKVKAIYHEKSEVIYNHKIEKNLKSKPLKMKKWKLSIKLHKLGMSEILRFIQTDLHI